MTTGFSFSSRSKHRLSGVDERLQEIAELASLLGYKLSWGGLWESFVDMPHFELIEE